MDPSRPYASVSVLYMPIRAMTPDTKQLLDEVERDHELSKPRSVLSASAFGFGR